MIYSKLTSLALVFLLGLQLTVAQPHGRRHNRRDGPAPETKIVYVDQSGNPLDSTTTPHPLTAAPIPPTGGVTERGVPPSGKPGIVYTPYNDDGTCKSTSAVASDIATINSHGFGMVRIYGVDCNQVSNVLAAARPFGIKVFLGIFDMGQCEAQLAQLIQFVGGDWASVYAVSIGNEQVNSGAMSAAAMVGKVNASRNTLRSAGYSGPVVIVDTWVAIIANPSLCQNSDFVAANCHPFFDGNVIPSTAGQFMSDSVAKLQSACSGKEVMITETGWPHQGKPIGKCVPGVQEQHDALTSIHGFLGPKAFYFTSRDDMWKQDNPATASAEKFWGIQDFSTVAS